MHVTRVVVHKREHKMVLMGGEKEIKTYQIALGDLVGAKQRQGTTELRKAFTQLTPETTTALSTRHSCLLSK